MLAHAADLIGREVDLGPVEVTPERIRRYADAIGDRALAAGPCDVAPLGFALAIRGGPRPEVMLADGTVSVHGGHAITVHRPLTAPGVYGVRARVTEVFEKSGRSGQLTVIARRADIRGPDGDLVVTVDDQQIVRWRSPAAASPSPAAGAVRETEEWEESLPSSTAQAGASDLEVGESIGPTRRLAPSAQGIARFAQMLGWTEPLFLEQNAARTMGFANVIVPGPLQSALLEAMLRDRLPAWRLQRLQLVFRVSVAAGEPISMSAIVVERHEREARSTVICDLALENGGGDRTALGTAELCRIR